MVVDSSSSPRSTTSSSSSSSDMDLTKPVEGKGTWTTEEHDRFLKAIEMYPNGPWKAIADVVQTRTIRQTQTHAQKYREKLARRNRGLRAKTIVQDELAMYPNPYPSSNPFFNVMPSQYDTLSYPESMDYLIHFLENEVVKLMESKVKLLDPRASQLLEPVRVPVKLQERLEKAQKRFMNKDGGGIGAMDHANATNKKHLPDVILRNKMMAFEAKWKCKSKTSAYFDPLDTSLDRLTIEERDEVMNRIQTKVEEITERIESKYRKKKEALDHQGVFDRDTNMQRVQTMCLVELQRKCNVDRIKEQVLETFEQERNPLATKTKSRRAPLNVIDVLLKDAENIELKGTKKLHRLLRKQPREQVRSEPVRLISNQTMDFVETKAKADVVAAAVPPQKAVPTRASPEECSERNTLLNRHPHVMAVVSTLRANELAAKRPKRRTAVRQGDDAAGKPVTAISEWRERSKVLIDMGVRCTMELHRSSEQRLWDFTALLPDFSDVYCELIPILNAWKDRHDKGLSHSNLTDEDEKFDPYIERRRRCSQEYHNRQSAIKDRLHRNHAASAPALPTVHPDDAPLINTTLAQKNDRSPNVSRSTTSLPKETTLMEYRKALINTRPSTILDVRLNQLVRRKLTRSISTTGTLGARSHEQKLHVGHRTHARSQIRKKNALTWEWQVEIPQETKELEPVISIPQQAAQSIAKVDSEATSSTSPSKYKLHRATTTNLSDGQRVPLQTRLEQLWVQLDMPYHLKLSMLEKYATQEEPELFQTALLYWEKAAQVVVLREQVLGLLRSVHQSWLGDEFQTVAGNFDVMLLHKLHIALPLEWTPEIFETWAEIALPILTERCHELRHRLYSVTGDELTYQGKLYPSES